MTRGEFKANVFFRDRGQCVHCRERAADAHHLLERKLFPDGGYALDNGVSLCSGCHLDAETTALSPQVLRDMADITSVVLPPGFDPSLRYNKWGDVVNHRDEIVSVGPLGDDEGRRKAMSMLRG